MVLTGMEQGRTSRAMVLAVMGGVELDLRRAQLDPSGATLTIRAAFGGVDVRLPAGWAVDVEIHGAMSGVDKHLNDASDLAEDAPTLHVVAAAWLGGVEIRQAESPPGPSVTAANYMPVMP